MTINSESSNGPVEELPYLNTDSEERKIAKLKMKIFLSSSFPILLIGERGTGKTHFAHKFFCKSPVQYFNCQQFTDPFQGERQIKSFFNKTRNGLKEDSSKMNILFFDNVEVLPESLQATLTLELKSIIESRPRNPKGLFGEEVPAKLIFASSKNRETIREILLDVFYDMISFHVIELPELRLARKDREKDWKSVWIRFGNGKPVPNDPKFINWLTEQQLPSNFRDLERIAINYYTFKYDLSPDQKKELRYNSAFSFAKRQYELYHHPQAFKPRYNFMNDKTVGDMMEEYREALAIWAIEKFGSAEKASAHFGRLCQKKNQNSKNSVSARTLYKWRSKK